MTRLLGSSDGRDKSSNNHGIPQRSAVSRMISLSLEEATLEVEITTFLVGCTRIYLEIELRSKDSAFVIYASTLSNDDSTVASASFGMSILAVSRSDKGTSAGPSVLVVR